FCFALTATPDRDTLSLHDALPIFIFNEFPDNHQLLEIFFTEISTVRTDDFKQSFYNCTDTVKMSRPEFALHLVFEPFKIISFRIDRKSTRLNSSHVKISYAVFCLI